MAYKAVFIDIDGTFIQSDHTVSRATIAAVQQLKERGVFVVMVSARPMHGMQAIIAAADLQGCPVAALNGACIAVDDAIVYEASINIEIAAALYTQLQAYQPTLMFYGQQHWFAEQRNKYTDKEQKITSVPLVIQPFGSSLHYWAQQENGLHKILAVAPAPVVNKMQEAIMSVYGNQLNVAASKPIYLEIMGSGASKLLAVQFLMKHFQLLQQEIVCIGDNFNDKEMIAYAGLGIAMGNAPDAVKAAADYTTATNNNDGVAKAIARFFQLQD